MIKQKEHIEIHPLINGKIKEIFGIIVAWIRISHFSLSPWADGNWNEDPGFLRVFAM